MIINNNQYWRQLAAKGCATRKETTDSSLPDTFEEYGRLYHYEATVDPDKLLIMLEIEKCERIKSISTIITINFVASIILGVIILIS